MINFQGFFFFLGCDILKKTLLGNVFGPIQISRLLINKKITDKTKLNLQTNKIAIIPYAGADTSEPECHLINIIILLSLLLSFYYHHFYGSKVKTRLIHLGHALKIIVC